MFCFLASPGGQENQDVQNSYIQGLLNILTSEGRNSAWLQRFRQDVQGRTFEHLDLIDAHQTLSLGPDAAVMPVLVAQSHLPVSYR
jgi:hypothetical protein